MSEAKLHFVVLVDQLLTMLANMRLPPGVTSIDSLTRVRAAPPPRRRNTFSVRSGSIVVPVRAESPSSTDPDLADRRVA